MLFPSILFGQDNLIFDMFVKLDINTDNTIFSLPQKKIWIVEEINFSTPNDTSISVVIDSSKFGLNQIKKRTIIATKSIEIIGCKVCLGKMRISQYSIKPIETILIDN